MRIAAICWDVAGPGGLNTFMEGLTQAADEAGDSVVRFHASDWVAFDRRFYAGAKSKLMGHNILTVDGDISYAPQHIASNTAYLNKNFDYVLLVYLTPHPTKNQPKPVHIPFLQSITIPIFARISDGLWPSYEDFAYQTIPYINLPLLVSNASYATVIPKDLPRVVLPYFFIPNDLPRVDEPTRLVWTSQWKALKGIKPFLKALKTVSPDIVVDLYGCGIDYYQTRSEYIFFDVVGENYKDPEYSGVGRASYFGHVPLSQMPKILASSTYMIDWHGLNPKFPAYRNGSYNNTLVEALYYGSMPIVADQMLSSEVPMEFFVPVNPIQTNDLGKMVNDYIDLARDKGRRYAAQQWVLGHHTADKGYQLIKEVLCSV